MLTLIVKIPTTASIDNAFKKYRHNNIKKSQDILLSFMLQEMVNRDMVVEGDAYGSWELVELEETSDLSKVAVQSDDVATSALEYGTEPVGGGEGGGDIFADILRWTKRKGIEPSYGTQEQFAFAVARKIAEQGLPLQGGVKRPFNAAQKKAKRRIDRVWEEGLSGLIGELNGL
jgi:hypothetical protein